MAKKEKLYWTLQYEDGRLDFDGDGYLRTYRTKKLAQEEMEWFESTDMITPVQVKVTVVTPKKKVKK